MTARILSYLIIAMLCFTQLSACSDGGLNDASTVVLAGIDYSGSVTAERREYIRRTLDGMVTRLQAGQRLLVLTAYTVTLLLPVIWWTHDYNQTNTGVGQILPLTGSVRSFVTNWIHCLRCILAVPATAQTFLDLSAAPFS